MSAELIGILGILIVVALYFADIQRRKLQEKNRQINELASKLIDEYVEMRHRDTGLSFLAKLGLHRLKSDKRIREAIEEMKARTPHDPWEGQEAHIQDVDLVNFFKYVRENKIKFGHMGKTVEYVTQKIKGLN